VSEDNDPFTMPEFTQEPTPLERVKAMLLKNYPELPTGRTFRGVPLENLSRGDLLRLIYMLGDVSKRRDGK
jgi:hypothetical protein